MRASPTKYLKLEKSMEIRQSKRNLKKSKLSVRSIKDKVARNSQSSRSKKLLFKYSETESSSK